MKRLFISILLAALLCAGCSDKPAPHKENPTPQPTAQAGAPATIPAEMAKQMVLRYNQLLIEGYKKLNMTPLQEVATTELASKAYYHMAALTEGKMRMESALTKTDFTKVEPREGGFLVQTREVWDFSYHDIQSGKKKEGVQGYVYNVTYSIEPKDKGWRITQIIANGEETPDKKLSTWKDLFHGKPPEQKH